MPPVADEVDEEVALEGLAVGDSKTGRFDTGLRVVGVDVDDRHLEAARQAAGVRGAERLARHRRKAELVVDDEMDGAAGVVAGQARQVERFGDDALAREGGVTVNQDRNRHRRIEDRRTGLVDVGAGGAGHPHHHRVDRLEMARVRRHRDDHAHFTAVRDGAVRTGVVLHVARPGHVVLEVPLRHRVLELSQNLRVGLVEDVRHDVQAPAMGHADEHRTGPGFGRVADDLVEDRHRHVQPLNREAGLGLEGAVQEALERLDLREAVEQRHRVDWIDGGAELAVLHRRAQPLALFGHEHMRVVVTGGRAIDRAEPVHDIEHAGRAVGEWRGDDRRGKSAEVVIGHAVRGRVEGWIAQRCRTEGVELGSQVSVASDRLRQVDRADGLLQRRLAKRHGRLVGPLGWRCPGRKQGTGFGIDRIRIFQVAVVQLEHIGAVDPSYPLPVRHTPTILSSMLHIEARAGGVLDRGRTVGFWRAG